MKKPENVPKLNDGLSALRKLADDSDHMQAVTQGSDRESRFNRNAMIGWAALMVVLVADALTNYIGRSVVISAVFLSALVYIAYTALGRASKAEREAMKLHNDVLFDAKRAVQWNMFLDSPERPASGLRQLNDEIIAELQQDNRRSVRSYAFMVAVLGILATSLTCLAIRASTRTSLEMEAIAGIISLMTLLVGAIVFAVMEIRHKNQYNFKLGNQLS